MEQSDYLVHVCFGPHCTPNGSRALMRVFEAEIAACGLADRVVLLPSSCRSRCDWGPSVNVMPGNVRYNHVDSEGVRRIVREHLAGGTIVRDYLFRPPATATAAIPGRRTFTFDPAAFRPRDDE
jgi:(2Fe-2S) ferredoxin